MYFQYLIVVLIMFQPVYLEDRLVNGLTHYMRSGQETTDLKDALEEVKAPHELRSFTQNLRNSVICTLCSVVARILLAYRQNGGSRDLAANAIKKLCIGANIESASVCNGAIELNVDIFIFIVDNKRDLTPEKICNIIAQPYGCAGPANSSTWTVNIPSPLRKPALIHIPPRNYNSKALRVLQITDIHYDDMYAPGSNALCDEPLCCGTNQGEPAEPSAGAGTWGDYRSCDMPWYSVLNLMDQIQTHKDIDYMYFTGDVINHRVWATSVESNTKNLKRMYGQFRKVFEGTPVYPILGNHEPNPLNEFAPNNVTDAKLSTQWLYDLVAEEWSAWLPNSTRETIKKGGYYTVLVNPHFRIIALNSNVAYTFNWWLLYDDKELFEQLQWLTDTLSEAEKNGEVVHILSHVPTGDNTCLKKWSREYRKIIERFAHVITAQFVGHTHYDEMNLYFKESDPVEPISVAFNGGSFTTFVNVNPNYRIYDINSLSYVVDDFEEWIYNMTEANKYPTDVAPKWFKLYSFKDAYGLESMNLHEMGQLVRNMAYNQSMLDQYFRYKVRNGDLSLAEGCNQACHEENLCNLVTTEFGETTICDSLTSTYRDSKKKWRN